MHSEPSETTPASRGGGVTALLLLVAVGAATLLGPRPPGPEPATAPAGTFSAARAMETVTAIAGQPRSLGSPASDEVRDLLVDRPRAAGLDASVSTSVGANNFGGEARVGRVDNIVATLPGTAPTGAVVLAAHYDSVAAGPGAADDGAAVAAVLETVRALGERPPLRNDLLVEAFAAAAPHPAGDSSLVEAYRFLPNDTESASSSTPAGPA